jgi:hypothetical protein
MYIYIYIYIYPEEIDGSIRASANYSCMNGPSQSPPTIRVSYACGYVFTVQTIPTCTKDTTLPINRTRPGQANLPFFIDPLPTKKYKPSLFDLEGY